jgi:transposase-like protein
LVCAFAEFAQTWRSKYPAMISMWERSWGEFVPFLDFPLEIRKLIYTTNGIESLNSRFRQAIRRRGHFPTEQSAIKILYLTVRERRPNRSGATDSNTAPLSRLSHEPALRRSRIDPGVVARLSD